MAGRKPQGWTLIDNLTGGREEKLRMQVFLQTLTGTCPIAEACRLTGLQASQFFDVRRRWLQGALDVLRPKPVGRPPREVPPDSPRVAALEQELRERRRQLTEERLRRALAEAALHDAQAKAAPVGAGKKRRRVRGGLPLTLRPK